VLSEGVADRPVPRRQPHPFFRVMQLYSVGPPLVKGCNESRRLAVGSRCVVACADVAQPKYGFLGFGKCLGDGIGAIVGMTPPHLNAMVLIQGMPRLSKPMTIGFCSSARASTMRRW
jgi:hypothetical protein